MRLPKPAVHALHSGHRVRDNRHVASPAVAHNTLLCIVGVIICEGAEEDAAEFVHRLRQLRWKVCGCH